MGAGFLRQTLYFRYVPLNGTSEYVRLFTQVLLFLSQFLLSCWHVISLTHFGLCHFLLKVLRLTSSFTFLTFENESEKCMESILSTLLQSLVICYSWAYLLTPFGKSQLYLCLRNRTEGFKQKNRQTQHSLV